MTPLPDLKSLVDIVRADATSDDPLEQLAQAARSVGEMEQLSDNLLDHFVEACRANGRTWTEISAALGVSRQAAHKRFSAAMPGFARLPGQATLERFTERARAVLRDATEQARDFGQPFVGTEHLLLALFQPAEAVAAQVLRELGLTADAVRDQVRADPEVGADSRDAGKPAGDEVGYSPRAIRTLRHAVEEALKLGNNYVGTEHLLLGLFDDPDALGARILTSMGGDYEDIRERLVEKFATIKRAKEQGQ
jgi:Clp amino terminal domain, pathogenicity island component